MKSFIQEFKTFAVKGNVMDLAVAVVIGGAFGQIVSSLVSNIITPFMGVILGGVDFSNLSFSLGQESFTYGVFIQSVVDFLVIALVIFIIIKAINKFQAKEAAKPEAEKIKEPSEEVKLLREIRDGLRK